MFDFKQNFISSLFGITRISLRKHWSESDILVVGQLLNSDGQLLSINELCLKLKSHISVKDYAIVMNSISVKILSLFRNHSSCVTQQEVKLQNIHF